jgi:hypothetical protein
MNHVLLEDNEILHNLAPEWEKKEEPKTEEELQECRFGVVKANDGTQTCLPTYRETYEIDVNAVVEHTAKSIFGVPVSEQWLSNGAERDLEDGEGYHDEANWIDSIQIKSGNTLTITNTLQLSEDEIIDYLEKKEAPWDMEVPTTTSMETSLPPLDVSGSELDDGDDDADMEEDAMDEASAAMKAMEEHAESTAKDDGDETKTEDAESDARTEEEASDADMERAEDSASDSADGERTEDAGRATVGAPDRVVSSDTVTAASGRNLDSPVPEEVAKPEELSEEEVAKPEEISEEEVAKPEEVSEEEVATIEEVSKEAGAESEMSMDEMKKIADGGDVEAVVSDTKDEMDEHLKDDSNAESEIMMMNDSSIEGELVPKVAAGGLVKILSVEINDFYEKAVVKAKSAHLPTKVWKIDDDENYSVESTKLTTTLMTTTNPNANSTEPQAVIADGAQKLGTFFGIIFFAIGIFLQ